MSSEPDASEAYPDRRASWRSAAIGMLIRLDTAERLEAKAVRELCVALRSGLTAEQQRRVAEDLLAGEPPEQSADVPHQRHGGQARLPEHGR